MAWLGPAPAHGNDPFASLHALGEGLGCRGHGTVASEVGVIFGAEAFDDVGACGLVVGVAQDERISEDSVLAIDIDGGLAGFRLAWRRLRACFRGGYIPRSRVRRRRSLR